MKLRNLTNIIITLAVSAVILSCGKDIEENTRTVQERILKSYINTNYPGTLPTKSGLYIVDSIEGTGKMANDSSYVLVDYTTRYIDGTYINYCSEKIAKQLGRYKQSNYYGSKIWNLKDITPGVREVTSGIKEGGSRKAVIPAWLLNSNTENNLTGSDGSIKIYDIKVEEIIDDIEFYEIDILEEYAEQHYPHVDSTEFGYYFIKKHSENADTLSPDETIYFQYIGKYLDGKVFDTNIADTAKKYGLFNGDPNSYSKSSFVYKINESDAIKDNKFVKGFSKTLWRLKKGEKAVTFFCSDLGYGISGGSGIPGYMPLLFEIWVDKDVE